MPRFFYLYISSTPQPLNPSTPQPLNPSTLHVYFTYYDWFHLIMPLQ
jgi:hypothetical protein